MLAHLRADPSYPLSNMRVRIEISLPVSHRLVGPFSVRSGLRRPGRPSSFASNTPFVILGVQSSLGCPLFIGSFCPFRGQRSSPTDRIDCLQTTAVPTSQMWCDLLNNVEPGTTPCVARFARARSTVDLRETDFTLLPLLSYGWRKHARVRYPPPASYPTRMSGTSLFELASYRCCAYHFLESFWHAILTRFLQTVRFRTFVAALCRSFCTRLSC